MVTRSICHLVERGINRGINPVITCLLAFGLPYYAIFAIHFLLRSNVIYANYKQIIFLSAAISWPWIGAYFIWYYEKVLLNNFFLRLKELVSEKECNELTLSLAKNLKYLVIVCWTTIIIISYLASKYYICAIWGFEGYSDLNYVISILYWAIQGLLTGVGFYGVVNTVVLVVKVYKSCNLMICPYKADKLGGLGIFGKLTMKTTIMFATGSLYIPILLDDAQFISSRASLLIYTIVGIFSIFILLSFIVPNYLVYKKAKRDVYNRLDFLATELNAYITQILTKSGDKPVAELYEHVRSYYYDLRNTQLYPFNFGIFVKLFTSAFMPIGMTFLKELITRK